ncbi:MAG: hypothetical protein A2X64_02390 [Ignavibacteria bacterium GWF2_33_9]|nr:MAG: hypothetical protein A2X64_02390 [Ignavibacteria bacterium GWF2_33_9]
MNRYFTLSIVVLIFAFNNLFSQTISFTNIDVTKFPNVSTSFMALDEYGYSYDDITRKDFQVFENGKQIPDSLITVTCDISPMKVIIVLDKSTSMQDIPEGASERLWNWVIEGANTFINDMQYSNGSEVALTAFASEASFICDFTNDKKRLYDSLMKITPYGKTNMNKAFFGPAVSPIEMLKNQPSDFRRIIVFLTDGKHDDLQDGSMLVDSISNSLINNNIQLYSITLLSLDNKDLNSIAVQSGGSSYNIKTKEDLNSIYSKIADEIRDRILCQLSWPTGMVCDDIDRWKTAEIRYLRHTKTFTKLYQIPEIGVANIKTDESTYKFANPNIGNYQDVVIKLTPENAPVDITNFSIVPNTYFNIVDYGFGEGVPPTYPIHINKNDDYYIKVRFTPAGVKTFRKANLYVEGNPCPLIVPMVGGIPEIFVDYPENGTFFSKCDSVEIQWSGVDQYTPTDLFYSTNDGSTWTTIVKGVKNNKYIWIPGFNNQKVLIKAEVSPTQTYVWAMSAGGKQADIATGIALSKDQLGIYVCGYLSSPALFENNYVKLNGGTDAFLAKYDIDGNLKWVNADGSLSNDSAFSVMVDNQENVYYAGVTYDGAKFGNITPLMAIFGQPYVFIAKYDKDGNIINANTFGANLTYTSFKGWGRYVRMSGNNIQVIAEYTGEYKYGFTTLAQTNTPKTFTLTYDPNLTLLSVTNGGAITTVNKVIDADKFTYQYFNYTNFKDFDRYTLKSEGNYDIAITKYGQSSEGFDISDEFTLYSPEIKNTIGVVDLGICNVGDSCVTNVVELLENPGEVPAKITAFNIQSSIDPSYIILDSNIIGTVINPKDKMDLVISLKSFTRGPYTATITLTGDCDESVTIPIKAMIDCQTKTMDTIDFGNVFINTTKTIDISCLVENFNGIDLPIHPLIQGKNANEFGLIKLQPDTVYSKQCYETQLTFTPKQLGQRTGRINLSMVDVCGEQIIYLVGNCINPSATLPDEIDWKVRRINKNYDSLVAIFNPTDETMTLEDIYFSTNPANGEFEDLNSLSFPITLPPMETTFVPVRFIPTDDIVYSGELIYKIMNKDEIVETPVKLKGIGFYPQFEYAWNCGETIKPNDSSKATLSITNISDNSDLTIDRIRIAVKNGIYEWQNKTEPSNQIITPKETKDFFVDFYPVNINANTNNIIITADDYDGNFTDFWKETRFQIDCQAIGLKYDDTFDFGNQVICSNSEFSIDLTNQSQDTDIEVDFSNALITGTNSSAFTIDQNQEVTIKPLQTISFKIRFNPTITGNHSAKLVIPNNFGLDLTFNFQGSGKLFTITTDKKLYEQLPGKYQDVIFSLDANDLDADISNLKFKILYNQGQIRFDTAYFDNLITSNWIWNKPVFNIKGTIDIEGNGQLPGTFDNGLFQMKFRFLLDTITSSQLFNEIDYGCTKITDTLALIKTTAVCVDDTRKIYTKLNESYAILELPFPNPANDNIMLNFSCGKSFNLTVKLFDIMGNEVSNLINDRTYPAGVFKEKINVTDLKPGIYLLEFNDGISITVEKITITK